MITIPFATEKARTPRRGRFADLVFIGRSFVLEEADTPYIQRENFMLEFFSASMPGGAIGHTSGLARASFE